MEGAIKRNVFLSLGAVLTDDRNGSWQFENGLVDNEKGVFSDAVHYFAEDGARLIGVVPSASHPYQPIHHHNGFLALMEDYFRSLYPSC